MGQPKLAAKLSFAVGTGKSDVMLSKTFRPREEPGLLQTNNHRVRVVKTVIKSDLTGLTLQCGCIASSQLQIPTHAAVTRSIEQRKWTRDATPWAAHLAAVSAHSLKGSPWCALTCTCSTLMLRLTAMAWRARPLFTRSCQQCAANLPIATPEAASQSK